MSVRPSALGQPRVMLVIAMIAAGFILFFPARQFAQQHSHINVLQKRLTQLRAENDRLDRQANRLSDPAELEILARQRLGLVRPGEKAYFVDPVKPPTAPVQHAATKRSIFDRAWEWFTSLVRGSD